MVLPLCERPRLHIIRRGSLTSDDSDKRKGDALMLIEDRPTKSTALDPSPIRKPSMQMLWSVIPDATAERAFNAAGPTNESADRYAVLQHVRGRVPGVGARHEAPPGGDPPRRRRTSLPVSAPSRRAAAVLGVPVRTASG